MDRVVIARARRRGIEGKMGQRIEGAGGRGSDRVREGAGGKMGGGGGGGGGRRGRRGKEMWRDVRDMKKRTHR